MTTDLKVAATKEPQAKRFVNVWLDEAGKEYCDGEILITRAAAVESAEHQFSFLEYYYTLTDIGRINLEPEFSEYFHEQKADNRSYMLREGLRASISELI